MRHGVKKVKFKNGKDSNKMLMRKLLLNFVVKGTLTTTIKKVKLLKSDVERLVEKAKEENEANKNRLLKMLGTDEILPKVFKDIGQPLKDKIGGYTRIVRLGRRESDGSETARLEWVYPVVMSSPMPNKEQKEVSKEKPEIKTKK